MIGACTFQRMMRLETDGPKSDRLSEMLAAQRDLQKILTGDDVLNAADGPLGPEYVRDMVMATVAELCEVLDESSWKPAPFRGEHQSVERMKSELVDVFMFFMNLLLAVGMGVDELFTRYAMKREEVIKRLDKISR